MMIQLRIDLERLSTMRTIPVGGRTLRRIATPELKAGILRVCSRASETLTDRADERSVERI